MTQPSWGFLKRGVTTESDRDCIRELVAMLDDVEDGFDDYTRREADALRWALALVAEHRKDGEMDPAFQDIERDREERLAEEAGGAMVVGVDDPDHPVQRTLRERLATPVETWTCPHCGHENPENIPDCSGCDREDVRP